MIGTGYEGRICVIVLLTLRAFVWANSISKFCAKWYLFPERVTYNVHYNIHVCSLSLSLPPSLPPLRLSLMACGHIYPHKYSTIVFFSWNRKLTSFWRRRECLCLLYKSGQRNGCLQLEYSNTLAGKKAELVSKSRKAYEG